MSKQINPPSLPVPSGFSYAVSADGNRTVYFAGHTAVDTEGEIVGPDDIVQQFESLDRIRRRVAKDG